jgi:hypothetical protein
MNTFLKDARFDATSLSFKHSMHRPMEAHAFAVHCKAILYPARKGSRIRLVAPKKRELSGEPRVVALPARARGQLDRSSLAIEALLG